MNKDSNQKLYIRSVKSQSESSNLSTTNTLGGGIFDEIALHTNINVEVSRSDGNGNQLNAVDRTKCSNSSVGSSSGQTTLSESANLHTERSTVLEGSILGERGSIQGGSRLINPQVGSGSGHPGNVPNTNVARNKEQEEDLVSESNSSKISCMLINARSIVNKVEEMQNLAYDLSPDIVLITETWAKESIGDAELKLDGYEIFRKDRKQIKGGGCIIHSKSSLNMQLVPELTNVDKTETVWGKIKCKEADLLVGVCYHSPSANEEEERALHNLIESATKRREEVLICGDFNHRTIDWERLHSQDEGRKFLDLTLDCFLVQHVKEPTRGENILDLVLTSNENMVNNLVVSEPFGTSDHNIVTFDTIYKTNTRVWKEKYYDYRKADFKGMRSFLNGTNWNNILESENVEDMWDKFKCKMNEAVEGFVPMKVRKQKSNKPLWWNIKIQRARKHRLRAWQKQKKTKIYEDYISYKRASNKAMKEVKKAKKKYEKKLAKNIKSNPKAFFKYANSKRKVRDRVGPLVDEDGNTISDDTTTANILNNFFSSVFTQETLNNLPDPKFIFQGNHDEWLRDVDITPETISKRLKALKPDKAPGVDQMYPVILQQMAGVIVKPLTAIFKRSLETSNVPEDWHKANVTPIYKKGNRGVPENYRPVSLTCICSKIFETIVRDAIVDHLKAFNLIKDSQHGFVAGRSCLTNLLVFLEKVTNYVDKGYPVDVIYLDFSKAFDRVPHQRLLKKLSAHGIGGKVASWIETWLTGRKQRVCVNGVSSEWADVMSGVPQGSVLGPTLFIIYINDIDDGLASDILKFADDTKIIKKVATIEEAYTLQEDLHKLHEWSTEWQMLFNTGKCKVMHFGNKNMHYDYFMGQDLLETTEEEKDLGVYINHKLTPSTHIASIVKTSNQILGMIYRTYEDKSKENITNLYKSLVRPHLDYCSQAWRPYLQQDIDNIEKVQKRATRMISNLSGKDYSTRLKETQLMSLETRRLRADLIEVYKIICEKDDISPDIFFQIRNSRTTRGHNKTIFKQRYNLLLRRYSFSQRTIDEWNNLPANAVNAQTINQFKNKIDPLLRKRGGLTISQRRLPAPGTKTISDYTYYR